MISSLVFAALAFQGPVVLRTRAQDARTGGQPTAVLTRRDGLATAFAAALAVATPGSTSATLGLVAKEKAR